MGYDEIILLVGNFGRYQRRVFAVLLLPAIACAFHEMGGVFLGAKPDFRCLLHHEHRENATYQLSSDDTINLTSTWNEETKKWPRCEAYNTKLTNAHYASEVNLTSVKCNYFVYDKTFYTQTATTEWNLVCDNAWLKLLSDSLFVLGDVPGVFVWGVLSDRYGRKTALLWGSITQLTAGLLLSISLNFTTYMILRILIGATTSSLFLVGYVAAMEMSGPQHRTTAGVTMTLMYSAGTVLSVGLAYYIRLWRYLQVSFTIPTIVLLASLRTIPESVRWLLNKGRVQEAMEIISKISYSNGVKIPSEMLDGLLCDKSSVEFEKSSILDLLRFPNMRKQSLLLFCVWFISGATYYGLSWNTSNLGGNVHLNFVFCALTEVPATLFIIFVSDRWGRKVSLCGGMFVAGISLLLSHFIPIGMTWLVILAAMIGKLAITFSWAAGYIVTAELYPTAMRNVGVAFCSAFGRIGAATAPHIINLSEISTSLPLVIFGLASLFAGSLSVLLPETLNKNLPQTIQDGEAFWKNRWNAKGDPEMLVTHEPRE